MRSIIITTVGLILWSVFLAIPKMIKKDSVSAKRISTDLFIVFWFIVSAHNMWKGVQVGYGFFEELPIFLMIFLIPTVAALLVKSKFLSLKN